MGFERLLLNLSVNSTPSVLWYFDGQKTKSLMPGNELAEFCLEICRSLTIVITGITNIFFYKLGFGVSKWNTCLLQKFVFCGFKIDNTNYYFLKYHAMDKIDCNCIFCADLNSIDSCLKIIPLSANVIFLFYSHWFDNCSSRNRLFQHSKF